MFDLNDLAVDLDAAESGVRMDLGNDAYVVIARWGNKKQGEAITKRMRQLRRKIGQRDPTEKEAMDIMVDVIAETIVLDWGGIYIGSEKIPYNTENVRRIWNDNRLEDFQKMVIEFSKDAERYRTVSMEEDLGNLPNGSSGTENTAET